MSDKSRGFWRNPFVLSLLAVPVLARQGCSTQCLERGLPFCRALCGFGRMAGPSIGGAGRRLDEQQLPASARCTGYCSRPGRTQRNGCTGAKPRVWNEKGEMTRLSTHLAISGTLPTDCGRPVEDTATTASAVYSSCTARIVPLDHFRGPAAPRSTVFVLLFACQHQRQRLVPLH
mmetsp:Transcript_59351/g.96003  ORF Transcript_59351/g.96003 Transcript_59351/m.96003 type:complete len:175 (-) Transcript_59351:91-615(-)